MEINEKRQKEIKKFQFKLNKLNQSIESLQAINIDVSKLIKQKSEIIQSIDNIQEQVQYSLHEHQKIINKPINNKELISKEEEQQQQQHLNDIEDKPNKQQYTYGPNGNLIPVELRNGQYYYKNQNPNPNNNNKKNITNNNDKAFNSQIEYESDSSSYTSNSYLSMSMLHNNISSNEKPLTPPLKMSENALVV